MKFSLSWLKACLDTDADAVRIAATLNAIGLEVEGVDDPAAKLVGFRVARVLSAERHPAADKLQVLSVDAGNGAPLQVVCGASNARAGLVGVLGLPGAVVPASGMALKVAAVRGVESHGMMCSSRELDLGDDHAGIIELPEDAPVGTAFADYHGADPVFDVAITPNRPDCMGVYGIARDLAAAGLGFLKPIVAPSVPGSFACPIEIRTEDPEGCPAFYGRVISGVTNGESPEWLRVRLKSSYPVAGDPIIQNIIVGLQKYGMILADNGSNFFFQGAPDTRWDDNDLNNLKTIPGSDFEVVQMTPNYPGWDANSAPTGSAPSINSFTASASTVASGTSVTLSWSTSNDSYDFIDKLGGVRGGSITITPTATTTYTLNATNQNGRTTKQVTVTVQ